MRKLFIYGLVALIALFSCSNSQDNVADKGKVREFIFDARFSHYSEILDTTNFTILRSKEIKAYNPLLDDDRLDVYDWYEEKLDPMFEALMDSTSDRFDVYVKTFRTKDANSEATVVQYSCNNNTYCDVLFKKDGEYVSDLYDAYNYANKIHSDDDTERMWNKINRMVEKARQ